MKKIFSVLLSFVLVASLCACGNDSTGSSETTSGNTDNVSNEKQEILEALTSDDGEWGCFAGDENSPFSSTGPTIYIYRFMEDGTFVSSTYQPVSYNMGIEYVGGREGTYEIGDTEIEYTYEITDSDGNTESKTKSFSYSYEDGVLELSVPSGQYHKDDWDGIVEDIRESGVFEMIDEYRLDS